MSEILQLNEQGTVLAFFAKNGIPSTVTSPTFVLYKASDGSTVASGSLTAQGSFYPYTFQENVNGLFVFVASTSDVTSDYPTFIELVRVGQGGVNNLDAAISTMVTTSHFDTTISALQTHGDNNWSAEADLTEISADVDAILGIVQTIGGLTVTITQPVLNANTLLITLGDDYKNADGRAFTFGFTSAPSITSATARLKLTSAYSTTPILTKTGTIVDSSHCYFEMTTTDTASLALATRFELEFTLSDGNIWTAITLDMGKITISGQAI